MKGVTIMCSVKTMIKIALAIGVLLIVGYAVFPEARAWIAAVGPYLLFLACPLAMYFAMKGMNTPSQETEKKSDQDCK
jgi:CHASE2 domain-containing sensor protein